MELEGGRRDELWMHNIGNKPAPGTNNVDSNMTSEFADAFLWSSENLFKWKRFDD